MAMTNPNKRDKNAQRLNGSESMSKHGTAKTRARARNRRRAAERTASNAATGQAQPPQGQAIPTSCSGSPPGVSSDATGQGEPARGEAIPTHPPPSSPPVSPVKWIATAPGKKPFALRDKAWFEARRRAMIRLGVGPDEIKVVLDVALKGSER